MYELWLLFESWKRRIEKFLESFIIIIIISDLIDTVLSNSHQDSPKSAGRVKRPEPQVGLLVREQVVDEWHGVLQDRHYRVDHLVVDAEADVLAILLEDNDDRRDPRDVRKRDEPCLEQSLEFMESLAPEGSAAAGAATDRLHEPRVGTKRAQLPTTSMQRPKRCRKTRKQEIDHLRAVAAELEKKLRELNQTHNQSRLGSDPFWKRVSNRLLKQRQQSAVENARLRDLVREQMTTLKTLQRSLEKTPSLSVSAPSGLVCPVESSKRIRNIVLQQKDVFPEVQGTAIVPLQSKELYRDLFRNLSTLYSTGVDTMLPQSGIPSPSLGGSKKVNIEIEADSNDGLRMCLQVVENKLVPFSFRKIREEGWKTLTGTNGHEDFELVWKVLSAHWAVQNQGDEMFGWCKLDNAMSSMQMLGNIAVRHERSPATIKRQPPAYQIFNFTTPLSAAADMTSGNLQIQYCGLLWLLASVYIVRTKRSEAANVSLIIQRPRIYGGLLAIPLDRTVRLLQCSSKDVERNIIRLQYGRRGRHLIMRAANTVKHKEWITEITYSMATFQTSEVMSRNSITDQPRFPQASKATSVDNLPVTSIPLRLSQSLDAIKRLADGYDNLAVQWAQVATETRQFSAEIANLQSHRSIPRGARPS
ncbi:hypothetical protein ON010_g333 [Phytophthora cinnamomi]|nr:hypothetical protein ON010_g333 [Phytophthora cinnamomi]